MSPGQFGRVDRYVLFSRTSQRWNGASNKLAATLPYRQDKGYYFFRSFFLDFSAYLLDLSFIQGRTEKTSIH